MDTADMALYWAARLDPDWANPLYARAMVILRALRADQLFALFRYRSTLRLSLTPRQAQVVDSLVRLAWAHNPLLFTDVDLFVMPLSPPGATPDPGLEGWRAYKLGDFPRAESLLAVALRLHPDQVELRISRAQSLALLGRYDSAAAELGVARDTVRVRAVSHASPVLPSLEMFEYAIGILRVNQGDFPSAREAFGRALTENLAFYMGPRAARRSRPCAPRHCGRPHRARPGGRDRAERPRPPVVQRVRIALGATLPGGRGRPKCGDTARPVLRAAARSARAGCPGGGEQRGSGGPLPAVSGARRTPRPRSCQRRARPRGPRSSAGFPLRQAVTVDEAGGGEGVVRTPRGSA